METIYFNKFELNSALTYINSDPKETKLRLEAYIKKYPKDYSAYPYYSSVLVILGRFNDAEKVLKYVSDVLYNDKKIVNKKDKLQLIKGDLIFSKLKLLFYQEKYDEAYNYCLQNFKELTKKDVTVGKLIFYCKKKLGRLEHNKKMPKSYIYRQIVHYEESIFLEHIKKHLADYNVDTDTPNKNIFISSFPLCEVLSEVKKYILSSERLYNGFLEDVYIFKYNNCGRDNNKVTNFFKVVCFHNTNEFITMLPISDGENLPYIDLNYLITDNKPKIQRLSQRDKFNKRYGIVK